METAQRMLIDEISKLSFDKISKVISYVRFVEQEPEVELWLDSSENDELNTLYASDDFVEASVVRAKVEAMPND